MMSPVRVLLGMILSIGFVFGPLQAASLSDSPNLIREHVGQARKSGEGLYRYWGFAVYDARLWVGSSPLNEKDLSQSPLGLELQYRRDFDGQDIARRSIEEMQDLGFGDKARQRGWLAAMQAAFPDIREGDRLLGIIDKQGATRFFFNGRDVGIIEDRQFSHAFFSIWLSADTSAPSLRKALLPTMSSVVANERPE